LIVYLLGKGRANWQFALSSRKAASKESRQTASLPYPRAAIFILSGRRRSDMNDSSENQPRRNEVHEGFFWSFLRPLRFFVVDFHCFRASQRDMKAPQK
jgi:hypothetical protein